METASTTESSAPTPPQRTQTFLRRLLGAISILAIAVAVFGFVAGWPHVWVPCAIAGILMLIDLRLLALDRIAAPPRSAEVVRRRTVAPILLGLALIALAIAASLFEGWGWTVVGIASLAAFGLMTLIAMPVLAAASHDAAKASRA